MFHKRKNIRLPNYDYHQNGLYFITICSKNRKHLFGKITQGSILLNAMGQQVQEIFQYLHHKYPDIDIVQYLIMPDHVHAIIRLMGVKNAASLSLRYFINTFKGMASRTCKTSLWQRGYYDHIIRNKKELLRIMEYIENNPRAWEEKRQKNRTDTML